MTPFYIRNMALAGMALLVLACGDNKRKPTHANSQSMVIADEISNHNVRGFAEDAQGHLWMATFRGLNKFDGAKFYQYFCTDDSSGLPDNNITAVVRDMKNRLWVATVNGVCRYTDQNSFERIDIDDTNRNVTQLLVGRNNRILAYNVGSVLQYDERKGRFVKLLHGLDAQHLFMGRVFLDWRGHLWVQNPTCLRRYVGERLQKADSVPMPPGFRPTYAYMHNTQLWLCANNGIRLFDMQRRIFLPLPGVLAGNKALSNGQTQCIHADKRGKMVFGTANDGIWCYDPRQQTLTPVVQDGGLFGTDFRATSMFSDSNNNLWMGSTDQGFCVNYQYTKAFNANNALVRAVGRQSVLALAADAQGNLFVATKTSGLMVYNLKQNTLTLLPFGGNDNTNGRGEIRSLLTDAEGNIWMGTSAEVIKARYHRGSLAIERRHPTFYVMSLTQGKDGTVWATTASNMLVGVFNNGEMRTLPIYPATFVFMPVAFQLRSGLLLTAAFAQQLVGVDPQTLVARTWPVDAAQWRKALPRSAFIPTSLYEDPRGNVYVGTVTNGLLRIAPGGKQVHNVQGLSCNDISAIAPDRQGNLWVSTMNGLNKLDAHSGIITSYFASDGIGGNQFNDRAACCLPSGEMVFGGTHGLTIFNPAIVNAKQRVKLVFEVLKVHNEVVAPGENSCIDRSLQHQPTVYIAHNQNSFSISFAALAYGDYPRACYAYQLEGFDRSWVDAGNNREAVFANLPAGKYRLKVWAKSKGNNEFDVKNELNIVVEPAPWNTIWAWALYLLAAAALGFYLYRLRQRWAQEKAAVRQAELEKRQEQRVNQMNMSFFANISHEFRTPLTMIAGPVDMLCQDHTITETSRQLLHIVQRSVARMLRLVNQLMDFNKLENDTLKLKVRRMDIVDELHKTCDVFAVNAKEKGITMRLTGMEGCFLTWLDADKLEKIMSNLLSNAMKFTPQGGTVGVDFDVADGFVKINVSDSGRGIPENERENIFKRYYQLDNDTKGKFNWGTGIGLYFARRLALLHHGQLIAGNVAGERGALFTLTLPTDGSCYAEDERTTTDAPQQEQLPMPKANEHVARRDVNVEGRPTILVVDDDAEVVNYLQTLLTPMYNVVYRFDAESAYQAICEEAPSLVLSDVVMPGRTGYDLCREIKANLQLCHIPVVLVTAKATVDNQVEGLNTGADAYIAKPFAPKLLLAMIHSLLANREKVRQLLNNSTSANEDVGKDLSPQDKVFIAELYRIMEAELSNADLDVALLTEKLHISRTKLYYKMKGLTGENPSAFFKTYKLNRAAELLREGKYTIGEIADLTGFNTLSHFSTSFKKQFGVSPSEFK